MVADSAFKGDYVYGDIVPHAPNPCIVLEGSGVVGLPLSSRDGSAIIANSAKASDTRHGQWEVAPDRLAFANPEWQDFVESTARSVCNKLNAKVTEGALKCELQAMLLYAPGSQ